MAFKQDFASGEPNKAQDITNEAIKKARDAQAEQTKINGEYFRNFTGQESFSSNNLAADASVDNTLNSVYPLDIQEAIAETQQTDKPKSLFNRLVQSVKEILNINKIEPESQQINNFDPYVNVENKLQNLDDPQLNELTGKEGVASNNLAAEFSASNEPISQDDLDAYEEAKRRQDEATKNAQQAQAEQASNGQDFANKFKKFGEEKDYQTTQEQSTAIGAIKEAASNVDKKTVALAGLKMAGIVTASAYAPVTVGLVMAGISIKDVYQSFTSTKENLQEKDGPSFGEMSNAQQNLTTAKAMMAKPSTYIKLTSIALRAVGVATGVGIAIADIAPDIPLFTEVSDAGANADVVTPDMIAEANATYIAPTDATDAANADAEAGISTPKPADFASELNTQEIQEMKLNLITLSDNPDAIKCDSAISGADIQAAISELGVDTSGMNASQIAAAVEVAAEEKAVSIQELVGLTGKAVDGELGTKSLQALRDYADAAGIPNAENLHFAELTSADSLDAMQQFKDAGGVVASAVDVGPEVTTTTDQSVEKKFDAVASLYEEPFEESTEQSTTEEYVPDAINVTEAQTQLDNAELYLDSITSSHNQIISSGGDVRGIDPDYLQQIISYIDQSNQAQLLRESSLLVGGDISQKDAVIIHASKMIFENAEIDVEMANQELAAINAEVTETPTPEPKISTDELYTNDVTFDNEPTAGKDTNWQDEYDPALVEAENARDAVWQAQQAFGDMANGFNGAVDNVKNELKDLGSQITGSQPGKKVQDYRRTEELRQHHNHGRVPW